MNPRLHVELVALFGRIRKDRSVRVLLLTGAGRSFCAGGDIGSLRDAAEGAEGRGVDVQGARELIHALLAVPQPVVCALNGDAVGLGATLALFCDVVLAAENARIGDPHVRVGLVPGDGGAVIWPLLIGPQRAKEYLMLGDLVPAPAAERMGLINHVYPADELMPAARSLSYQLAAGAREAIEGAKRSVNQLVAAQVQAVLDLSLSLEALSSQSADHREGLLAFLEKRTPHFGDAPPGPP